MIEEKLEKRISCNNEFGGKIMKKKESFMDKKQEDSMWMWIPKKMKEKKNKKCQKFGMLMMIGVVVFGKEGY